MYGPCLLLFLTVNHELAINTTTTQLNETSPVTALKRVGPKLRQALKRLHIETVQDLLFHLPSRYQDRTQVVPIAGLRPGIEALIEVEVLEARQVRQHGVPPPTAYAARCAIPDALANQT